jgi:hypothetical protein
MHPSVVLACAALVSAVWTVVCVRRCRNILATAAPASETWHAVGDAVLPALLFAIMVSALLAPLLVAREYLVTGILLLGVTGFAFARVRAQCARRRERRIEEQAMLERGLPVREPVLAWKTVGVLAFVCGLFVIALCLAVLTAAVTLLRGAPYAPGNAAMTIATAIWIGGASIVTLRQWLRIRRIDRRYWPSFRAALERAEPRR